MGSDIKQMNSITSYAFFVRYSQKPFNAVRLESFCALKSADWKVLSFWASATEAYEIQMTWKCE